MTATIFARYSGHCRNCGERISTGDSIRPTRTGVGWNHDYCPALFITPPRRLRAVCKPEPVEYDFIPDPDWFRRDAFIDSRTAANRRLVRLVEAGVKAAS